MPGFSVSNPFENKLKSGASTWSIRHRYEGETKQRNSTFPTKAEANARADELREMHRKETLSADTWRRETTFEAWLLDWWPRRRRHLSAATRGDYTRVYEAIARPRIGQATMHELTKSRSTVRRFFDEITQDYGPSRQRKIHTAVSAAFTGALDEDRTERNPCARTRLAPLPVSKRAGKALAADLVVAVWEELGVAVHPGRQRPVAPIQRLRSQVFYSLMVGAGMRPAEVCALRWGDITSSGILVTRGVKRDGKIGTTKTKGPRTARMADWLRRDLDAWAASGASGRGHDELVFVDRKGAVWKPHAYEHWRRTTWVPAMERVAARRGAWGWCATVDPYSAGRATHCSLALAAGENPSDVARRVGNTPETLFAHYDHPIQGALLSSSRETVDAVIERARQAADLQLVRMP